MTRAICAAMQFILLSAFSQPALRLSSAWPQEVFHQKRAFDAKTVTPLVAIREIGLQSHAPIGIVFGANQSAL
jgi:hypothetical protein